MKHWTLQIRPNQIRPLLDQPTIEKLQDHYLDKVNGNYTEWLKNVLNLEMKDWKSPTNKPETDENQKFRTTAPKDVIQMILQIMNVASKMLGEQVTEKAFVVSLVQFVNFGHLYKDAVVEYKNEYFADRNKYIHCFTSYMIAISNNCEVFQVGIK